jgi:hypothetical protein
MFVIALSVVSVSAELTAQEQVAPEKESSLGVAFTDVDLDGDVNLEVFNYVDVLVFNELQHQTLGLTTAAADATLIAQLELPDGTGLVVAQLDEDGPAAKAGVQLHDILLTADDTALLNVKDLNDVIKKVSDGKIDVQLLRVGETIPLEVQLAQPVDTQIQRFTELSVSFDSYRIGVEVVPASAPLRAQLRLPAKQGIVIKRFVPEDGSPAEEAGLKEHDVLLSAGKRVLSSLDDLRNVVESSEGKAITITLLRSGKRETVDVTPRTGNAFTGDGLLELRVEPGGTGPLRLEFAPVTLGEYIRVVDDVLANATVDEPREDPAAKLQAILQQLEQLTVAVEELKPHLDPSQSETDDEEGAAESKQK